MKTYRVMIDLDGVLIDFSSTACKYLNINYESVIDKDGFVNGDLENLAGGKGKFWKAIRGYEFWSTLQPYPWANDIIKILNQHAIDWVFLTKTSLDSDSAKGKFETIRKYWPREINRLWLVNGSKARICRGHNDILIDDKWKNINEWKTEGGSTYYWPEVSKNFNVEKRLEGLIEKLTIKTA